MVLVANFSSTKAMTRRDEQIATLFREGKSQRAISRTVGISQPAGEKPYGGVDKAREGEQVREAA